MSDARPGEDQLPFYLDGLHAPIEHEVEAFDLPVEGTIPPELAGLYVRNGPNPLGRDPGHWFLGDGMLHAVELQGGRANLYMGDPEAVQGGEWQRAAMNAYSATIGGGTSEVQHNILGERVLDLPK